MFTPRHLDTNNQYAQPCNIDITIFERYVELSIISIENVFTFGGAKRSGSDRECKYFPIGMNAREPLWRLLTLLLLGI